MVDSRISRRLPAESGALALVRARIDEKRLFEARFLCRKLDQGVPVEDRAALEQELRGLLGQVEQLRQQARALMNCGENGRAGELFQQIEAIAIDVPGVAEDKQALADAETLAARLLKPPLEAQTPVALPRQQAELAGTKRQTDPNHLPGAFPASQKKRSRNRRLWVVAGLATVVLGVLLAVSLVWQRQTGSRQSSAISTSRIVLQPLLETARDQSAVAEPLAKSVNPALPSPPPSDMVQSPAAPVLKLGNLQVEQARQH